jgi:hypothetical protein
MPREPDLPHVALAQQAIELVLPSDDLTRDHVHD